MLVKRIKKISILKLIVIVLVCLMPTHRMLFDAIIPGRLDNLWRDALLIVGIIIIIAQKRGISVGRHGLNILLMWIVCGIYLLLSDRFALSLNLARTYLVPTLIYFIIINIEFDSKFIQTIEKVFIYVGVFLAIFGMVQAFILGEQFLFALGYESNGEYLAGNTFYISHFYGTQRVVSTFSAPNICGLYFGMVLLVILVRKKYIKNSNILALIMLMGLVTTFSRSSILGTAVAILVLFICKNINYIYYHRSVIIKMIVLAVLAIMGVVIINNKMGGLIFGMLESSIMSIVNGTDASASKHMEDLILPLKTICENPLGLGFGNNGPMVLEYYKDANLVESSVYLLAYDFGVVGALVFLLPYIRCVTTFMISIYRKLTQRYDGRKSNQLREKYKIPGALSILVLIVGLLLPTLQTFELLFVFFLYLGICEMQEKNVVKEELMKNEKDN